MKGRWSGLDEKDGQTSMETKKRSLLNSDRGQEKMVRQRLRTRKKDGQDWTRRMSSEDAKPSMESMQ